MSLPVISEATNTVKGGLYPFMKSEVKLIGNDTFISPLPYYMFDAFNSSLWSLSQLPLNYIEEMLFQNRNHLDCLHTASQRFAWSANPQSTPVIRLTFSFSNEIV